MLATDRSRCFYPHSDTRVRHPSGRWRWLRWRHAIAASLAFASACSVAQSADDGFAPAFDGAVNAIVVQPDGRVLVGGAYVHVAGQARARLARLNADGSIDAAFSDAAIDGSVEAIALQPDGRILIAGAFAHVGGQLRRSVSRLNADGSLDATFLDTAADATVHALVPQRDGRLVIGGDFTAIGGQAAHRYLARLNADGSLDPTFADAQLNAGVRAIETQGDRHLVGGLFDQAGGGSVHHLARFHLDGRVDTAFVAPAFDHAVRALARQAGGDVLVAGDFSAPRSHLARITALGELDPTFTGPAADAGISALAVHPDGHILIGGAFTLLDAQPHAHLARLSTDGGVDPGFIAAQTDGTVSAIRVQSDGKVLAGGLFTNAAGHQPRSRIARFHADGSLDRGIEQVSFDGVTYTMVAQPDGKILVGGEFEAVTVDGVVFARSRLARLLPDGSLDEGFVPPVLAWSESGNPDLPRVLTLALELDGKILVGGAFTSVNGQDARHHMIRLLPDGTLDGSFVDVGLNNTQFDFWVSAIARGVDGKLLIGGSFVTIGPLVRPYVARLNANGSPDPQFNGPFFDSPVVQVLAQADGKILLGGLFNSCNGMPCNHLVRLSADGAIDAAFADLGLGFGNAVSAIAIQPDGRILAGTQGLGVVRANADGTRDSTFAAPAVTSSEDIYALALQADGKVFVGGNFLHMGSVGRAGIARLDTDGSLDPSFADMQVDVVPGDRHRKVVGGLLLQEDGKLLASGGFTMVGGQTRRAFARLSQPLAALQSLDVAPDGSSVSWLRSGSAPELAMQPTAFTSDDGVTFVARAGMQRVDGGWRWNAAGLPLEQLIYVRARSRQVGGLYGVSQGAIESVRQVRLSDAIFDDGFDGEQ